MSKNKVNDALAAYKLALQEDSIGEVAKQVARNSLPSSGLDIAITAAIGITGGAVIAATTTSSAIVAPCALAGILTYNQLRSDGGLAAKALVYDRPKRGLLNRLLQRKVKDIDPLAHTVNR